MSRQIFPVTNATKLDDFGGSRNNRHSSHKRSITNIQIQSFLLTASFIFYALARYQTPFPQTWFQIIGMLFAVIAALRFRRMLSRNMLLLITIGLFLGLIGWIISGGLVAGLLNSTFILVSFPLTIAASKGLIGTELFRNIMIVIIVLCLFGVASGQIDVTYLGDDRENRWILGFQRPTFLSEAMVLFIIASIRLRTNTFTRRIFVTGMIVIALIILQLTGSRAGMGAAVVFLLLSFEAQLGAQYRVFIKGVIWFVILIVGFILFMGSIDDESLNTLTTGRWLILAEEIGGNLKDPIHWAFGNTAAETIFDYSTERISSVYHVDSFFGERLIVNGFLGLIVLFSLIWMFWCRVNISGRIVIVVCIFYGLVENDVFNITSMFSIFMMVFAAASVQDSSKEAALSTLPNRSTK